MHLQQRFRDLLVRAAAELYEDHPDRMERPDLIPTPNTIDDADLVLFFEGLESGLIRLERGGKFNTLDRPTPSGRWSLLSRSRVGPGARRAYRCSYAPLVLDTTPSLPSAEKLRLTRPPAAQMVPPTLH